MAKKEVLRFFMELGGKSLVDDVKAYEKAIKQYDKHYLPKPRRFNTTWRGLGAVKSFTANPHGLLLACEQGWVELHVTAADCIRVRMRLADGNFTQPFSYAVAKTDWHDTPFEYSENSQAIEIRTASMICRIIRKPFRIALVTLQDAVISTDKAGIQWREDGAVRLSMALQAGESSYGMGERAAHLNLRGKRFQLWNVDPPMYNRDSDPLYYNIPFYLGVHQNGAYGVFWDNTNRGTAELGVGNSDELAFEAERGELCYYLFGGQGVENVLARYTELTGRIYLPPLWSLGYHQCRFSYTSEQEVLAVAREFRNRGVPCDVIYLDIHYMDGFRVFTLNERNFPRFRQMIATLHDMGFKLVVVLDPGVKIDKNYAAYRSGLDADVFVKYPDGRPAVGVVWPGACHFLDFSKPSARAWWAMLVAKLAEAGVDGIWNDMNEPAVFTPDGAATLPDYLQHDKEGLGGDHLETHNVYGMLMGRASLEGLMKQRPNQRQFNMIRAGYAGAQRYASTWTGDNTSDWDHLRLSVSMALNMGLSGAPMTGSDVGGFQNNATGELLTRWLQASTLMPYFRGHTSLGTHAQEPWSFGQPYEVINRLAIELRYQLLPYLYSVVALSREFGSPVVQPIFMAEPDNPKIRSIDDCYMLGDSLLVAPVLEPGAVKRSVYLPAGEWYDYWTSEALNGGRFVEVVAPLERLPLFVRAGTVLPKWPVMQYVGAIPETLYLRVYPGTFETVTYEDAGEGLGYESGDYRWVYTTCQWEESRLTINRRTAGRYVPPYTQVKLEVVGFDEEPMSVRVDRQGAPLWFYDDGLLELTIDSFQRIEIMRKPLPTDRTIMRRPW